MRVQHDPPAEGDTGAQIRLGQIRRRATSREPGPVSIRPLSDPGAAGRVAPFAGVAVIALLLELLPANTSTNWVLFAAAVVLTAIVVASALLVPWVRLPAWCQALVPLTFFAVVALLRQAGGGAVSGYTPMVILPILWLAIYGSRIQLWLAIAATVVTFLAPLILVGPPLYPAVGWRESIVWLSMAVLAGSAIQTLVDKSRHRTADVEALGAITRALTAGSDPRAELCAAAQLVTRASFAVLFEPDGENLVATAGTDGIDLEQMRTDPRAKASAAAQSWRTGQRIYIGDTATDPRASGRLNELTGARGALCQPVTRDQRRMGVLVIGFAESRRQLPATALYLVELVAAEIGAAIDRADLVTLLAIQSRSDPLTGATNRRGWDEDLDRELVRARRTGDPLTVAIIDMDRFKGYNDNHGHVAGDVLLKDLVIAIRAELRTGDVIARWGGEEFVLALPDCDLEQAHAIASRLLRVVPSGQTASIGLTQAQDQDTPRTLIERADRALYTAKNGGRNQVKACQSAPKLDLVFGHDV